MFIRHLSIYLFSDYFSKTPLKLTTSHTYVYKKLDEFGKDYNKNILESFKRQGEFMKQQMQRRTDANSVSAKFHQNRKLIVPDVGRKLVFGNIDYRHEVHYMTEEHQSVDNHCVTVMAVENRVSGSHLSDQQPEGGVLQLENGKCIPSRSISIIIVLIMITNMHNINPLSPKVPSLIISLSLRQTILLVNEDSCASHCTNMFLPVVMVKTSNVGSNVSLETN